MTDVIAVALERRARLEAEIVRLNEFVLMAQALTEWSEGRRLLPAVSLGRPAPRMVLAHSNDRVPGAAFAASLGTPASSSAGAAPTQPEVLAVEPDGAHGGLAGLRDRLRQAVDPRGLRLALRHDETSTSLVVPADIGRLHDRVRRRLAALRAALAGHGVVRGLSVWLRRAGGRAFREDETATSDLGNVAPIGGWIVRVAHRVSAGADAATDRGARARPAPRPVDAHVGQRLRQRRWMTGLTRQQLAEMAGFEPGTIAGHETGDDPIAASRLWEIAAALDVPVAYFFEGVEGQAQDTGEARGEVLSDDEAMKLVRAYYAIPESQRQRLWDLARMLRQAA